MRIVKKTSAMPNIQPGFQIEVRNLTVAYKGQDPTLNRVNLLIEAGKYTVLRGASGSGKTTLLNEMRGVPSMQTVRSAGSVFYDDYDIFALSEKQRTAIRAQHIGFVPQGDELNGFITGRQNISRPRRARGINDTEAFHFRVESLAERLGIVEKLDQQTSTLSGGERKRIAILRGICNATAEMPVLMLDEPTSSVDQHLKQGIDTDLLRLARDEGATVISITHELQTNAQVIVDLTGGVAVNNPNGM